MLAVFLCLAALYESWTIPMAVMLVVPLGVLGVVLATLAARVCQRRVLPGRPDHHHRPVGQKRDPDHRIRQRPAGAGQECLIEAALGRHLRFRPIMMTSLAFILGVLPLAMASGAGSASQRAIGTGVMGGMITGHGAGRAVRAGVLRGGALALQGQRAPASAA
jgi:multidrug efflux pump